MTTEHDTFAATVHTLTEAALAYQRGSTGELDRAMKTYLTTAQQQVFHAGWTMQSDRHAIESAARKALASKAY